MTKRRLDRRLGKQEPVLLAYRWVFLTKDVVIDGFWALLFVLAAIGASKPLKLHWIPGASYK